MKHLGAKNFALISQAIKAMGTYNPAEILCLFEEQLTIDEVGDIAEFLAWCHRTANEFNSGNYEEVFRLWQLTQKASCPL